MQGQSNTLSSTPLLGFSPIHTTQGSHCRQCSRFRVAQSPILQSDWVERCIATSSALRLAASLITGTALRHLQRHKLAVCAPLWDG